MRPLEVAAYLRSAGWKKTYEKVNQWATWVINAPTGEEYEAAVPLDTTLRDFALRMADVLRVLEAVEERSQLEILQDLNVAAADLIRVRLLDVELADGTVPIEDGAQFFQKARDMMLAAACAAASPRACFPSKKPSSAMEYMRRVRFGQTERGSFVATIVSRVAPSLAAADGQIFEVEEPFERRVTQTLARALASMRTAAEIAAASGKVDSFVDAVPHGVSANLCDAVTGMAGTSEAERPVEVAVTWSRFRPLPEDDATPRRILLPADAMPVIREAARYFKDISPREDFEVRGPVVKLEREEGASTGRVTVHGFVDDQPRKITVELGDPSYHKAVTAHDTQQMVACYGVLVREGKSFRLKDPQDFSVPSDQ